MNSINMRIHRAIEATKSLSKTGAMPENYFEKTLASRQPNTGVGSVFESSITELELIHANWRPYPHPEVKKGCTAFMTRDIPGFLGVVDLKGLNPGLNVFLEDIKGTGFVMPVIKGVERFPVSFTVIILGNVLDDLVEVVFTFHPGNPIRPSEVKNDNLAGKLVSIEEAINLGCTSAKVVGDVVTSSDLLSVKIVK